MPPSPVSPLRIALLVAVALGTAAPARAGLISLSAAALSANGAQITTLGQTLAAWNVNGNAVAPPTINGVTFSNTQPSNIAISGFPALVQDSALTNAHYSAPMNELMNDMVGTNTNNYGVVTLSGFKIGQLYQVQFLHHQDTNQNLRNMRVIFGNSDSLTLSTSTFNAGNNDGYITTFLFTADAASQAFRFRSGSGTNRALLNAALLTTTVPEPSTLVLALGGLGGCVYAARRRRRNRTAPSFRAIRG